MRDLHLYEAARFLGCTQNFLNRLLHEEILSSTNEDELAVYIEKAPVIHDHDLAEMYWQGLWSD